jgi:hypothetical protein
MWLFDEKADARQREALIKVGSGEAGGLPFEIIRMTFSKLLPPRFVPFRFTINGVNSGVKIGDAVDVALEPIKNPVNGAPESIRVEHETGFMFKSADILASSRCSISAGELTFSHPNKTAFFAHVNYAN